jgi:hypothetical protein
MAEEKEAVRILAWPSQPALLEHRFDLEKPCPVSILFEDAPASVLLSSPPEQSVRMDMNIAVKEAIALCVRVCEPICAKSEYTIGISVFDHPVVSIALRGLTRIFNCREEEKTNE